MSVQTGFDRRPLASLEAFVQQLAQAVFASILRQPALLVDIILVKAVMSLAMPRLHAAADVFRAVADANRRALLDAMVSGETAVGQLAKASGLSYSAVSQHLAILREAGLVESRRKGRHQLYRLEPGPLSEVHAWVGRYERFWRNRLGRLKHLVEATR